jgi:acetolactate decarboxylase
MDYNIRVISSLLIALLISLNLEAQVMYSGSMSQMGQNGFSPSIGIDTLLTKDHLYGIGPYGKMQGELTVLNGVPLIAFADEKGMLTVSTDEQAKAPFFVYAYVEEWKTFEIEITAESDAEIQEAIEILAIAQGYDITNPFPFRILGEFDGLTIHVVAPRSPDVAGYQEGVNSYKYNYEGIAGEIFGFYSQSGQGIYTHKDSFVHLHFSTADQSKMGHIDAISIKPKKVKILLPFQHSGK